MSLFHPMEDWVSAAAPPFMASDFVVGDGQSSVTQKMRLIVHAAWGRRLQQCIVPTDGGWSHFFVPHSSSWSLSSSTWSKRQQRRTAKCSICYGPCARSWSKSFGLKNGLKNGFTCLFDFVTCVNYRFFAFFQYKESKAVFQAVFKPFFKPKLLLHDRAPYHYVQGWATLPQNSMLNHTESGAELFVLPCNILQREEERQWRQQKVHLLSDSRRAS